MLQNPPSTDQSTFIGAQNLLLKGGKHAQVTVSENWMMTTQNYFLEAHVFSTDFLAVTFETAGPPHERPYKYRMGWSAEFLRNRCISHLAIKVKEVDWYLKPDLAEAIALLHQIKFLSRFGRVMTYGSSMGGFAALAYADLIGASEVLAISPQVTLDPKEVPWDNRFLPAKSQDWTGPHADAARGFARVGKAYVVTDMNEKSDRRHALRLAGQNLEVINIPNFGHEGALPMNLLGMLGDLFLSIKEGTFDATQFQQRARGRRKLSRYFKNLLEAPRVKSSKRFTAIVNAHKDMSPLLGK